MKYRIKEFMYKRCPMFVVEKRYFGFIWVEMPETSTLDFTASKKILCNMLKEGKEYPKYHGVDCDD